MHDEIDTLERAPQAVGVADVANEVSHGGEILFAERLTHLQLLQLVTAVDHEALHVGIAPQHTPNEGAPERASAAGDEDGFVVKHDARVVRQEILFHEISVASSD